MDRACARFDLCIWPTVILHLTIHAWIVEFVCALGHVSTWLCGLRFVTTWFVGMKMKICRVFDSWLIELVVSRLVSLCDVFDDRVPSSMRLCVSSIRSSQPSGIFVFSCADDQSLSEMRICVIERRPSWQNHEPYIVIWAVMWLICVIWYWMIWVP
jgi:hypothetical protein